VSLLYLIPVFAIFIAWIWLREIPETAVFAGGVLALAGVLVVNLMGRGAPAPTKAIPLKAAA